MSFRSMKLELQSFVPELNAIQCGLRINRSYEHLLDLHPWSFLNLEALVKLVAPVTAGKATVTLGLATVTGVGTAWAAAQTNAFFRCGTNTTFYKITGVVGQTLTLETAYNEASGALQAYTIFQNLYAKPIDCKVVLGMRWDYNMPRVTKQYLDTLEPDRTSVGQPLFWSDRDDVTLEVWPVPDQAYTMRLWYKKLVADMSAEADTCLVPERLVLAYAVLAAYRQLAGSKEGSQYAQLVPQAAQEYADLMKTAVEQDMQKLSLPTTVIEPGDAYPQSNDFYMRRDVGDPRGYM